MPDTTVQNILSSGYVLVFAKGAILLILIFYAIFALIVVRQVNVMSRTLITNISGVIKAISIIHAGFAIGLIVLVWGVL